MSYEEEIATISRIELFAHLSKSDLKRLVFSSERYQLEAGEILFKEGDQSDTVFLVIEGELAVCVGQVDMAEIAVRGAGELVGDMAAISGEKRSATLRAKKPTQVIGIDGPLFIRTVTEHPETSLKVMQLLGKRLSALSAREAKHH